VALPGTNRGSIWHWVSPKAVNLAPTGGKVALGVTKGGQPGTEVPLWIIAFKQRKRL